MKRQKRLIYSFFLGLITSLTVTAAYSQNKTPIAQNQDVIRDANGEIVYDIKRDANGNLIYVKSNTFYKGLNSNDLDDPELWMVFFATMVCGGLGGFIFELINLQGNIERSHSPTDDELAAKFAYANANNVVDLGVWARIIIGALAAPPAMLVFRPESAFALLGMSVIAGSAGTAVFRAIQDRLLMAVNQKENEENKIQANRQSMMLDEALKSFSKLKERLINESTITENSNTLYFKGTTDISSEELDAVEKLLSEAKGLSDAIAIPSSSTYSAPSEINLVDKVEYAIAVFARLKTKLLKASSSPASSNNIEFHKGFMPFMSTAYIDQENLDIVEKTLYEIKGAYQTITNPDRRIILAKAKINDTINAFAVIKKKLGENSTRPTGQTTMYLNDGAWIEQEHLDNVDKLLSEIKGLHEEVAIPDDK